MLHIQQINRLKKDYEKKENSRLTPLEPSEISDLSEISQPSSDVRYLRTALFILSFLTITSFISVYF